MKMLLLILLIFLNSCTYLDEIKTGITGEVVLEDIKVESGSIEAYFCPRDNCEEKLINLVESSEKIHCALFELNLDKLIESFNGKDYFIVTDDNNLEELADIKNKKPDNREALMHNKFCIFDDRIISTGSFNPTINGNSKNNNNLVIVKSTTLAKNYEAEFQSFINDEFGKDAKVKNPRLILNNEILIENYFCPEDDCELHVYDLISKAKNRIYFMAFSFTSDKLGDLIIEKSNEVAVKGIFENFQSGSKYSELNKMGNMDIISDRNPNFMHHKVFIVDDSVVLGSYNPTSSGNSKNDENILIVHDKEIADKFMEEFDYVWNL